MKHALAMLILAATLAISACGQVLVGAAKGAMRSSDDAAMAAARQLDEAAPMAGAAGHVDDGFAPGSAEAPADGALGAAGMVGRRFDEVVGPHTDEAIPAPADDATEGVGASLAQKAGKASLEQAADTAIQEGVESVISDDENGAPQ